MREEHNSKLEECIYIHIILIQINMFYILPWPPLQIDLLGKAPDKKTEFVIKKNLTSNYLQPANEKPKEKKVSISNIFSCLFQSRVHKIPGGEGSCIVKRFSINFF